MASSVSRGRPGTDPLASGRVRIPGPSGRDLDRDADRDQRHRLHGRADDPGRSRARDGGDRRGRRRARGDPREVRAERSDPRPVPALGGARAPGRPRPLDPDARPGDDDRGQEAADHRRAGLPLRAHRAGPRDPRGRAGGRAPQHGLGPAGQRRVALRRLRAQLLAGDHADPVLLGAARLAARLRLRVVLGEPVRQSAAHDHAGVRARHRAGGGADAPDAQQHDRRARGRLHPHRVQQGARGPRGDLPSRDPQQPDPRRHHPGPAGRRPDERRRRDRADLRGPRLRAPDRGGGVHARLPGGPGRRAHHRQLLRPHQPARRRLLLAAGSPHPVRRPILLAITVGVPLGLVAGYYRGALDQVIMRLTDAWLAFPFLILAIGLVTIMGPSLTNATIATGLGATPTYIRLTRGLVLSTAAEDYVQGARALGAGDVRLMGRHILPNIFSSLLVQATVSIPIAIIAEAVLSFLGLGVQPPTPSWGTMLNGAQQFLESAPWMAWWPGLAIFSLTLSFNLAGDGLRDLLDPKDY